MHCGHSMIAAGRNCCEISTHQELTTADNPLAPLQKQILAPIAFVVRACLPSADAQQIPPSFFESPPGNPPTLSSSILRI